MDNKQIRKRYLSLFLALIMLIGTLPIDIFAETFPTKDKEGKPVVNTTDWALKEDRETARYWPIPNQGRIVKVSTGEPIKNPSLRYIGGYTRPDGREVIRLAFSAYSGSTSAVWERLILKPDHNLNELIDWKESCMARKRPEQFTNNHDGYNFNKDWVNFESISATQGGSGDLHVMDLTGKGTNTVKVGTVGSHYEVPIDLVIKEGKTVKKLDKNPLIQMRLTDAKYEGIYSTTISTNQAIPYSSYTMSTFVPVRVDLKQGILNTDVVRNHENLWQSASSYIKYNEEKGYFDVYMRRTHGTVGSRASDGDSGVNSGDYGFMQSFDESLIDILKPQDKSGTVIQLFSADDNDNIYNPSGEDPSVPKVANRIDYSIKAIKRVNGVGIVKYSSNTPGDTFLPTGTTLTTYGRSTVVRYYIDKAKLKEKFGSTDLISYEFFSTLFATNPEGVEEFKSVPRDADIDLKRGDTIDIRFDGRRDLVSAGTFDKNGSFIQIGDDQYKISIRTTADKSTYTGGGIVWDANYMRKMTVSVPFDIKIKKDTPLTIFSRKTKLEEVSPGMTVTFNYSAKNDDGSDTTKSKTYRFEREFSKPGYTMNDKGEVFFGGKKVNDPQNTLFKDNHDPLMLARQENFGGGILASTVELPDVDEVFTDSKYISGRTKYESAKIYLYGRDENNDKPKKLATMTASDKKVDVVVNRKETKGYEWSSQNNNPSVDAKIWTYKDTPLFFTNQDVLQNALENKIPVAEQVQAKVTFKPGGPLGDDISYEKIAPLNKEYLYKLVEEPDPNDNKKTIKKFVKNDKYKGNGFGELDKDGNVIAGTLDNIKVDASQVITVDGQKMINYINHDGKTYDTSDANQKQALAKRQWPVVEENGSKFIQGKVLIGWTTKKLEDDANGTAAQKYYKLLEEKKIVTKLENWTNAKTEAYVYNSKSPMEEAITVYGVWGEPAIRLHSNFDKDAATGMQEDVDTQVLEKAVIDKLKANDDPTTIDATLKSVYDKNEFKRDGYSLVGFSRTADANEPDVNVTGEGLTADNYLRDGDTFKLADTEHNYTFDATKGLDLYAVWKVDFTVKATKAWLDKDGKVLTAKQENVNALKFALIGRPAVGTFGSEVVVQGATYHPIEGTIKDFTGSALTWGEGQEAKLKGYDTKGRRMSYLIVELTTQAQVDAFNAGSTNWSDYGIKITEADPENHVYGHKDQVISFKTGTDVDTFTGATTRLHKTATNPEGVNPHGSGPAPTVGYFDTTGYVINVNNKEVVVPYPTIEQGYTGDTTITVNPPAKMVDKITVTLPDGTTAIFKKNAAGTGYETTTEGNTTATLSVTDGKLVITPATPLAKDQVVKAKAETDVAGQNIPSEEVSMKVIDRKVSNKPEELKQEKYDESGNVPISFKVPDNITDKPVPGTVYTVVTVDDQGKETPTSHTYTIPADGAETIPGTRQTITVPKSELEGKKVIIKAEEPNKTPTNSDKLDLDFTAPTVTPDARDERWRRWTDVNVVLSEAADGPIILSYKENDLIVKKEYDTKEEISYDIARLSFNENVSDMTITATDQFGNKTVQPIDYAPIGQTQITVSPIRAGRNFVLVKVTEANTKVVVNVYDSGTLLDSYARDKYFDFIGQNKPTPKATVEMTFSEVDKLTRMRIKDTSGNAYKLQKGDVIDIVGTIGTKGPDYKITNPFTEIVK